MLTHLLNDKHLLNTTLYTWFILMSGTKMSKSMIIIMMMLEDTDKNKEIIVRKEKKS